MAVTKARSNAVAKAAKGDLSVGSGTNASSILAVGTDAQILVADSTASTGLKWATPATSASGLTLIKRATYSAVANTSTTFDGVFTSTYKSYFINFEQTFGTNADDLYFQYRYGTTTQATGNLWYRNTTTAAPASSTESGTGTYIMLARNVGPSGQETTGYAYVNQVGQSSTAASIQGAFNMMYAQEFGVFGGGTTTAQTYTGFILTSSGSTMSGTVAVYGLATA